MSESLLDQPRETATESFPPSPAQAGLWFASTYGGDPTAYNQPLVLRLPTALDHDHLVAALHAVHLDHCALRTTFEMDADGEMRQVIHGELPPIVDVHDHHGPDDREKWIRDRVAEVARTVFDLRAGPLVRVRHLRIDGTSLLVFNIHHTVFDGMSWKPYLGQLETAYTAISRGDRRPRRSRRQAVDAYARWAKRWASAAESGSARHWRDRLANPPPVTPIGLPGEGQPHNVTHKLVLRPETTQRVRTFCTAEGMTTSMFFVAVFFMLLHRQTRQDDVLVGMPVTVREGTDGDVVGHLTNTVVLRHRLSRDATARDVLHAVKRDVLDMLRHRHVPIEAVVSDLRATGGYQGGTADLFNAMITVMPSSARRLDLREWGVRTWEYTSGGAKYDLALVVDEAPDRYTLIVEHTSATDQGGIFVSHLARRLERLVRGVTAEPDTAVHGLSWMDEQEQRAITAVCARRTDAPTLGTEVTADLFAAVVAKQPSAPAVVADGGTTSYADLDVRVGTVAADLVARGVRAGQPVAVLVPPGLALVTTILGILRAGGSYVPLDPGHPAERLSLTIRDCGATLLVCDPRIVRSDMDVPPGTEVVASSELNGGCGPPGGPGRKTPGDTAYIVYTSGSTGRPKGVAITEATLANLARAQAWISSGRRLRTLQYMSPAFDVFALELVGAVGTGGTLVIPPAHARTDFAALAAFLAEQRVERAYLPYVALRELAATLRTSTVDLSQLREVYVTGERLVVNDDLRAMFRHYPDARLINAYGPSEAHWCTAEVLAADPDAWPALPPIGRVVPGVDARVLVEGDQLAAFGVEGELCVAGPVVSPGYLNLPEKTAQAMGDDPFGPPGQRMYRTGDVVVLTPDGRLHYRGRADDQVKIRGYRVEPGEVEATLERVLGVETAAVIAQPTDGLHLELHAFVQSAAELPADWRTRLAAALPDYMMPRTVTRIDGIPVTPTGKTDRRALAAWHDRNGRKRTAETAADAAAPTAGDELGHSRELRVMVELWTEVLGHAPASPDDDFFLLGGHSLLAARLHRLLRRRLGMDVALSALLRTPTLHGMAQCIRNDRGAVPGSPPDLRAEARLDSLAVSPRREPSDGVVLLTGATGFLGSHLLAELQRGGRRVRCLIRAGSTGEARDRLRETFDTFAMDTAYLDEVEIVAGDLAAPRLGLGAGYETLAGSVTEVYHAAAHINFVVPYHTVKNTNVEGLRRLLEFCGLNRTPLRLISTMGVFPPDSTSGVVNEDAVPGDPASLGIGYSQSKWVAERLGLRAREFGLPVTLHRVGRIGGHSRTGACRHDDFFWLQMKSFAVLGCHPDDLLDAPPVDLLPVDHVARAIVRLSTGRPDNENWHLHHHVGLAWPRIIDTIRAEGYVVEPVSRAAWMTALESQAESDGRGQGLGSLVPFMREGVMRLGRHSFDSRRTRRALTDVGCPHPTADTGWLRRMFAYFRTLDGVPT